MISVIKVRFITTPTHIVVGRMSKPDALRGTKCLVLPSKILCLTSVTITWEITQILIFIEL
jgi:hypothetical protein